MSNFDVLSCAKRLEPWIIRTPLVEVEYLSAQLGKKVFLKLEGLQRTGAFKFRGALNYMLTIDRSQASRGVITASSGNHGLGMSLAGSLVGLECTVVMPVSAPLVKQNRAKAYGATVVLYGGCYDEAQDYAKTIGEAEGLIYVPSFNHPAIIEGQGTILSEILTDMPHTDMVFAPIGGGGLVAGLLLAGEQLRSEAAIVGVEPFGAACMKASLDAAELTTLTEMQTVADGVAVRTPGSLNFAIVSRFKPPIVLITDDEIKATQRALLHEAKIIVETAGAVSVAGMLKADLPPEIERIVSVVSGANVDLAKLPIASP
jgi:threonine dehydratase